ncbi:MAG: ABC transporter permease [Dehalococcoidia bacterium]|nr:ABC transporter permease [Dehalococcoidia bacterium]
MAAYAIRRILAMVPLLWAVATVTFILMHLVPGGPFEANERPLPDETLANLEAKYGLDESLGNQYVRFLGNLVQLDLGHSFEQDRPVSEVLTERWRPTVELGLYAFGFAMVVGIIFGVITAVKQNKWEDYAGVAFTTIGVAIPNFVMAAFLVIVFSLGLGWFDVIGWDPLDYRKVVLPSVALGLLPASYLARIMRASMLEILQQDYVRTARAKGLVEYKVVMGHVVKNAMIPVLTVAGPIFAGLITGSFIIELAFQIPGIGTLFVTSILTRDYGVIMGTTLLYAAAIAVINLVVDLTYGVVDPRIRY